MDPKLILLVISIIQFSVCYPFSSDSLPCSYEDFENVVVNCKGAVFHSHICDNLKQDVNISSVSAVSFESCRITEYSDILNQFPNISKLIFSRDNILPSANFSIFEHLSLFKSVESEIRQSTASTTQLKMNAANLELFYFKGIRRSDDVSSISLQNATQLVFFYLQRTYISSLPADLFKNSNNLTRIHAERNEIENIDSMIWPSSVRYMDFSSNKISQLTRNSFRNLTKLQILELQNNEISQIEAETFSHLNNLVWLRLDDNHIKVINKNMLKGLNNLIAMNLYDNDFNYIEDGAFESTPNLSAMSLNTKNISSFNRHTFAGLNRLLGLGLEKSSIRELTAESFNNLAELRYLEMSAGKLETADFNAFANLPKLGHVSLSNNRISRLVKMASTNWNNNNQTTNNTIESEVTEILNGIDFKWMKPIFTKAGLIGIEAITDQFEFTLDASVFKTFVYNYTLEHASELEIGSNYGLKKLILSRNQLAEIEKYVFAEFRSLKKLYLSSNPITTLHPESFAGLNELESLHLDGGKLTSVDFAMFTHLTKLQQLDLSNNQLTTITAAPLSSVVKLKLNNNQLTDFPMKKSDLPNLKTLWLYGNRLACSNLDYFFVSVEFYCN